MTPVFLHLHSVSAIAADFLIASVWQGLVIAAGVALLLRLLPGLTAAIRSAIWAAVLLLVVLLPGISLALHSGRTSAAASSGLWHASDHWSLALLGVWLAFSLLRIVQLAGSALYLRAVAARATAIEPGEPVSSLLRGSRRRVQLCLSTQVDRPSVAGFFRPRILLSPELLATLSPRELQQVVLHEMEHLRRYDDWTNLLQKLSLALLPLHPVLLWLDRQMCVERERACDDSVLRHTRARKAYAACLARLAEDSIVRRGFSLALGALGSREHRSELAGRVHRILRAPEKRMNRRAIWMATAALFVGVFTGAAELARTPQLVSFNNAAGPVTAAQLTAAQPQIANAAPPTSVAAVTGFQARRIQAAQFQPAPFQAGQFQPAPFQAGQFQPAPFQAGQFQPAPFQPASFHPARRSAASEPHVTLVKAVMPARAQTSVLIERPHAAPPLRARRELHRTRLTNLTERAAVIPSPGPSLILTAWRPIMPPLPRLMLSVAEDPQDPQFLYAAVPLQGGWLIIQL